MRHMDEGNPFIGIRLSMTGEWLIDHVFLSGREEFLMNRIVQRNGAAPPWVEAQGGK